MALVLETKETAYEAVPLKIALSLAASLQSTQAPPVEFGLH